MRVFAGAYQTQPADNQSTGPKAEAATPLVQGDHFELSKKINKKI